MTTLEFPNMGWRTDHDQSNLVPLWILHTALTLACISLRWAMSSSSWAAAEVLGGGTDSFGSWTSLKTEENGYTNTLNSNKY